MTHKYKVIHFVNDKQVCEWKEEEIDPILYLNDFYNFIDKKQFDNAWGHGQGSKDEIYDVLKKHLNALKIIRDKIVNVQALIHSCNLDEYNVLYIEALQLTKEEYDLLKEVLL